MNNPFSCPHCKKHHQDGHPKIEKIVDEAREKELDALQKELRQNIDSINARYVYDLEIFRKDLERKAEQKYLAKLPTESTEPILAYRVWRYKDGMLQSTWMTSVWPGFKPMTKDIYENAGIHSVKDYKKIPELMQGYNATVAGSISIWGQVEEREIGYLSEFAYPKELFVGPEFDPLKIMTLEDNYGVPVTIREELKMPDKDMISARMSGYTFSQLQAYYPGAIAYYPAANALGVI